MSAPTLEPWALVVSRYSVVHKLRGWRVDDDGEWFELECRHGPQSYSATLLRPYTEDFYGPIRPNKVPLGLGGVVACEDCGVEVTS